MTGDPANENAPPAGTARCATCGKPVVQAYRPFCSKRCADVDLQRWFTGRYAIPVVEDEDGPDDPSGDNESEQDPSG
jgi:endogenous inhibitor of DNA gyrase (YacG/DUF329 family)